MSLSIILDSGPLALLVQRPGFPEREICRKWFDEHLAEQSTFHVPEIVHYELRRELIRLNKTDSLAGLDLLVNSPSDRLITLNSSDLRLAAELWADTRQKGKPTADHHALDIDVILCAQVLNCTFANSPVVATTNVKHLSLFVDAREWQTV